MVTVQTPLGNVTITIAENVVSIYLPKHKLDDPDPDITVHIPQCNVAGVQSNYELSIKHFSELEREHAIKMAVL